MQDTIRTSQETLGTARGGPGSYWKSEEAPGNLRGSGVMNGDLRSSQEIPGVEDPWKVEGISENPGGYQGNPWEAHESLGSPKVS